METSGFGSIGKASSGGSAVTTVAGRTGDVVLGEADIASLTTDLAAKAPLASPVLTGTPTVPTAAASDNSTKAASTAYADAAVGVETTRATAAETLLAPKASPTFTGTVTLPSGLILPASVVLPSTAVGTTQTASDNSTKVATTAYADAAVGVETTRATAAEALKAPLASPTLTGTPSLPTGTTGVTQAQTDSSTKLATTAFVTGMGGAVGGFAKVVRRTSNSSTISSNSTFANDDTLLWAVGASDVWFFQAFLLFTAANSSGTATTEDLKVQWSVPTGGLMTWGALATSNTGAAGYTAGITSVSPGAINTQSNQQAFGAAAVEWGISLAGTYVGDGTHTGNVNLQWAQNTSDASTLQIMANSLLILWRLA